MRKNKTAKPKPKIEKEILPDRNKDRLLDLERKVDEVNNRSEDDIPIRKMNRRR